MQTKVNRRGAWVAGIALVITALLVIRLLTWSLAREDILVVNNSPFPTRTFTSQSDNFVILETDYCKTASINGNTRMSFVSSTREIFLPVVPERLEAGCNKTTVPIPIPKDLPPDTYKIVFRVTYDINPIKENIVSQFESRTFMVGR